MKSVHGFQEHADYNTYRYGRQRSRQIGLSLYPTLGDASTHRHRVGTPINFVRQLMLKLSNKLTVLSFYLFVHPGLIPLTQNTILLTRSNCTLVSDFGYMVSISSKNL